MQCSYFLNLYSPRCKQLFCFNLLDKYHYLHMTAKYSIFEITIIFYTLVLNFLGVCLLLAAKFFIDMKKQELKALLDVRG